MAKIRPDSFQRLYSPRELIRGPGRWALLWSCLAAALLALLLIDLFLIADLLESGGRTVAPAEEVDTLGRIAGSDRFAAPETGAGTVTIQDSGLLPTVWRFRDRYWAGPLASLYRSVGWLQSNGSALALLVLSAVVLSLLRILALSGANRASEQAGLNAAARIRRALHRQTLRLGPGDLMDQENQQVLRLFTSDADLVRDAVAARTYRLSRYGIELALLLVVALSTHWLGTLQCLIPLGFIWYLLQSHQQQRSRTQAQAQARADEELRWLAESLRKTRLVRGYGMEAFEHERFQSHLGRFQQNVSVVQRRERLVRWGSRLLIAVGVAIVVFLIGVKVLHPDPLWRLPISAALLLWGTFALMVGPLDGLAGLRRFRESGGQAADRIDRYLERIPEVGQAVGAKFLQPLSRFVQYEAVRYHLPNRRVLLDGIDLRIPARTTTAFISLDPLETRAAAYLLMRFIEPQSGRVLIDGEDLGWVTLESLRTETVFVGGADPFFTGTVRENVACGDAKYSLQEVTEAAKQMHANKFILRLPQGFETVLGEHGEQLDAGQAFRLGLARAMLRNPALLVVEEPSEPLDEDTKALLDDAYTRLSQGRTVIFLPTRLSTVKRVERVVLIHRGRVEAVGNHADLVRSSPLYRHWEYTRFNEFRQE